MKRRLWTVVGYRRRGPGEVCGPYFTRTDAEGVRAKLIDPTDEENVECAARGWRYRVVEMYRLITEREFAELMAEHGPNAIAEPLTDNG